MKRRLGCIAVTAVCACALLAGNAGAVSLTGTDSALETTVAAADRAGLLPDSLDQTAASQSITREQLCSAAVRVYASVKNVEYDSLAEKAGDRLDACPFSDTDNDDVRLAWLLGLVGGKNGRENSFCPNDTVSEQLMNTVLHRAIEVAGGDVTFSQNQSAQILQSCEDADSVASWAKEATAYFLYQGVIEADEDNTIGAKDEATSQDLAVTAYRSAAAGHTQAMYSSAETVTTLSTRSGLEKISWSNCGADSYRIYYYTVNDFSENPEYIDLITSEESGTMEAAIPDYVLDQPGVWYWSVDAFDYSGKLLGTTENATQLNILAPVVASSADSASEEKTGSASSAAKSGLAYAGESYESRCERIFGDGVTTYQRYSDESEASSHQTTIEIPVWLLDSNGKKVSSTASLTVNTGIASTVQQIFQEIYDGGEQFPIYSVGGYNWREGDLQSEHCLGLAIDINPDENYECSNDGTAMTGTHWTPESDPYSMAADGDVVTIFEKYGFVWGGTWNSKKDYMHFSYFGT